MSRPEFAASAISSVPFGCGFLASMTGAVAAPQQSRVALGYAGLVVLHHPGAAYEGMLRGALYGPHSAAMRKALAVPLTLIPCYAWRNREPSFMEVRAPLLQS
jgi:hypothetical protein